MSEHHGPRAPRGKPEKTERFERCVGAFIVGMSAGAVLFGNWLGVFAVGALNAACAYRSAWVRELIRRA